MTQDEIICMAEECGIPEFENNESQANNIMRFAALVASAEREACAKVIEECNWPKWADATDARDVFAEAIRARTKP
jgi:hypothetical protein